MKLTEIKSTQSRIKKILETPRQGLNTIEAIGSL
jgi:hypothetical protein